MAARLSSKHALKVSLFLLIGWIWGATAVYLSDSDRGGRDLAWNRLQEVGILRVGVDPSIAPFGIWTEDSQVAGFDVDLARALGDQIGLEIHITPLTYDGFYDALTLNRVDIVIAALRPDQFRLSIVRYTTPYYDAGHVLVSKDGLASFKALEGKKLAVELASNGDLAAAEHANIVVERYVTDREALDAARSGDADAALVDNVAATQYLAQYDGLVPSAQPLLPDPYVIAVRRNEWRLYYALEHALIALRNDGTLEKLRNSWIAVP